MLLVFEKHKNWIGIVRSLGANKETSEDLVQEMYCKMHVKIENGLDIRYEDDINYYYIFKCLRTLYFDLNRKEKRIIKVSIDDVDIDREFNDVDYLTAYSKITDELESMYWYDRKVFEIINGGESIAEFSRKSKIQYYSLYNTYNKVKTKLKKLL